MSLFRKLWNRDPQTLLKKAEAALQAGDPGTAKLDFEKARALLPEAERSEVDRQIATCRDAIARERTGRGDKLAEQGEIELAIEEWLGAVEVAHSEDVRTDAQSKLDAIEQEDAIEQATTEATTDEELLALLAGSWEDSQADEYESHGDMLFEALIWMQKEQFGKARERLEALVEDAADPRYLWLEIGRARLLDGDDPGCQEAFRRFLDEMAPDEAGEAKLQAHVQLARIADNAGRFDEVTTHLEAAMQALPGDYRPYLVMGGFLRETGHAAEALEVLQSALTIGQSSPDWRLLQEVGLVHADLEQHDEAVSFLEQVIAFFSERQVTDFPPAAAVALAKAYEAQGRLDRAAGMYRSLSEGSDRDRHAEYHFQAGRLLTQLGMAEEAHRMLKRAEALSDDEALSGQIEDLLGETAPEPSTTP